MKGTMICKALIFVLVSSFFCVNSTNDKECQEFYRCSPSDNCQFYQEQITKIKTEPKSETKNEILSNLR